MSSTTKGYLFAFIATVAGSTVYIFSKAAFKEVSLPQFGVYWFGMALFWNVLYGIITKTNLSLPTIDKVTYFKLSYLGLLEIVATSSLFFAIILCNNSAVPSFLRNLEYLFIALLSFILLKERFVKIEYLGIGLTLLGVFVISYMKGYKLTDYLTGVSGLMLLSTFSFAVRTIIAKKNIKNISPTAFAVNRSVFLFTASFIALLALKHDFSISRTAFINIALGAFLGPFVTSIAQFSFLKYIEAARGAIIQSTTGLFVILGAYLYLNAIPFGYQIFGGVITIIGTSLLLFGKLFKVK